MKLLSIVALVLFVSANSFAQNGQPAAAEPAAASAPATETAAPKMEKKSHMKKKKHSKKHADKAAE